MEGVGVPISGLKQLIAMKTADRVNQVFNQVCQRFFDNQLQMDLQFRIANIEINQKIANSHQR
jgi:hypothetical protein